MYNSAVRIEKGGTAVKRNMRKEAFTGLLCLICGLCMLGGCGKTGTTENQSSTIESVMQDDTQNNTQNNTQDDTQNNAQDDTQNNTQDSTQNDGQTQDNAAAEQAALPDAAPFEFIFASGAGAWGTVMTLNGDASFSGSFHDTDMNSGERYDAIMYVSEFSGSFGDIKQINDYTYSMTLNNIEVQNAEKEWTEDRILYVSTEPYGLEQGTEYILYTPETPLDELSEDFLSWWPDNWQREEKGLTVLGRYGLYNKDMGYGFFTYEQNSQSEY